VSLLAALEDSPVGVWIRESEWGYPVVLVCHTLGMASLVGGSLAFELCILAKARPAYAWFRTIFAVAWLGFAVSLISGTILFTGAAQRFVANPAFQIKLAPLAAGAFVTWLLARRIRSQEALSASQETVVTRCLAGVAMLLWFGAIAAGRLMAYIR